MEEPISGGDMCISLRWDRHQSYSSNGRPLAFVRGQIDAITPKNSRNLNGPVCNPGWSPYPGD